MEIGTVVIHKKANCENHYEQQQNKYTHGSSYSIRMEQIQHKNKKIPMAIISELESKYVQLRRSEARM
jgi:hypothetical protein